MVMTDDGRQTREVALLRAVQRELPLLSTLLEEVSSHWQYEDGVYRFYHQSFKVYVLQDATLRVVDALTSLSPPGTLDARFLQIVADGTGKTFEPEHNRRWLRHGRNLQSSCGDASNDRSVAGPVAEIDVSREEVDPAWQVSRHELEAVLG